jgi:hypothetical protein
VHLDAGFEILHPAGVRFAVNVVLKEPSAVSFQRDFGEADG